MSPQNQALEARYREVEAQLRATVIERAQRIIDNPDLCFAPDPLQRELDWQAAELRKQFADLEARYLSDGGRLIFIGCVAGEHRKCVVRTKTLICACPCHGRSAR